MAVSVKTIKGRLRSISNTQKITRAMEMVSATKMRKTVAAVTASRPYAHAVWQLSQRLAGRVDPSLHVFLQAPANVERAVLVVLTANRGLSGSFGSNVMSAALRQAEIWREQFGSALEIEWLVIGKRGLEILARQQATVAAQFIKDDVATSAESIRPVLGMIVDGYTAGRYQLVGIVYTDYVSALVQQPAYRRLLPLEATQEPALGATKPEVESTDAVPGEYVFEPSADEVIERLMPRLIEIQLYQALLESNASEHAARMLAMRNASEAARDMMDDLTLLFNQARQAGITREIAEIAGGKAALEAASV